MKSSLYFLALLTPPDVAEKITVWKKEMAEKYGASHALKSPPHITLQSPFRRPVQDEDDLVEELHMFANEHTPVPIHLSGFDCFAPRVIYVDVANPEPVVNRYKSLQTFLKERLNFSASELNQKFHPHITIATRDLRKRLFSAAWSEFKNRTCNARFLSGELTLLKHNGQYWEVFRKFEWGG